jgi:hypothetical protein
MYQKPITQILREANEIEDSVERAEYMNKFMRDTVKDILAAIFNEDIVFEKFKEIKYNNNHNKPGISDSTLDHETKRLYVLLKDSPVDPQKKINKFIQMLESVCKEESELLESVIQKKNPYKKIDKRFIKKYFPEVFGNDLKSRSNR